MSFDAKKMFIEAKWDYSQRAEVEFWKQGEQKYAHFSRQYWEHELENYFGHIQPDDFACRPCQKRFCDLNNACMKAIQVEDVIEAIDKIENV